MKRQLRSLLPLLGFAALALACDSSSSPRPPDASTAGAGGASGAGGAGGAGGSGARGGAGGGGAGGAGAQSGATGRDGPPAPVDGPADAGPKTDSAAPADSPTRGVPDGPIIGGDGRLVSGGPCAADCMEQSRQYADALLRSQKCVPGMPEQCTSRAIGSNLVCGGACVAWVQETAEITAGVDRYFRECSGCTFHETPGRCHPIICTALERAVCKALPSGEGTCVNMEFDRPCPPGLKTGTPCDPEKTDYCYSGGASTSLCTCRRNEKSWFCFSDPGA